MKSKVLPSGNEIVTACVRSEDWRSPTLIKNRHAVLNLAKELRVFKSCLLKIRKKSRVQEILRMANDIQISRRTKNILAVPVFVGEDNLSAAMASIMKSGRGHPGTFYVFLLNADCRVSRERFAALLSQRLDDIEAAKHTRPKARFCVLTYYAKTKLKMGEIRGLLVDAVALAAARRRLSEVIIISNDADQISASSDYVKRIAEYMRQNPLVDGGEGLLRWGTNRQRQEMPEIILNELILQHSDLRPRRRYLRPYPAIHCWGANSFFRLSTYCAAGGYDYSLSSGEDAELLQRIEVMRLLGEGAFAGFYGESLRLLPDAIVTTDATKLVLAIIRGRSIFSILAKFNAGARKKTQNADMLIRYKSQRFLVQESDVAKARSGDAKALRKIATRIRSIYLDRGRSLTADPKVGQKQMDQFMRSQVGRETMAELIQKFLS